MSLPKTKLAISAPQCAGGPLVSLSSFLNLGNEPTGCALGAQPDF